MLEVGSIKGKLQKYFRGTQSAWNKFVRPGLEMAIPLLSAAVVAKQENPQSVEIASNF